MRRIEVSLIAILLWCSLLSYSQQYELEREFVVISKSTVNIKDIKVDSENNTYITGFFADSVQFGTKVIHSHGGYDFYLAKLDNNNNLLWVESYGSENNDYVSKLLLNNSENPVLIGTFNGKLFGSTDEKGAYIASLSKTGKKQRVEFFSGNSYSYIDKVEQDFLGNFLITGFFRGVMNSSMKTIKSENYQSFFVAQLNNNLNVKWITSGDYSNTFSTKSISYLGNKLSVTGKFKGALVLKDSLKSEKSSEYRLVFNTDGSVCKILSSLEVPREFSTDNFENESTVTDIQNDTEDVDVTLLKSTTDKRKNRYALIDEDTRDRIENHHHLKKYNDRGELVSKLRYKITETDLFSSKMDNDNNENIFVSQSTYTEGVHKLRLAKYFNCSNRSVNLCNDVTACRGDSVKGFILPDNITTYIIDNDIEKQLSDKYLADESKQHTILVEDPIGCLYRDTLMLNVNPRPQFTLGEDISVPVNSEVALTADDGFSSYIWNSGENSSEKLVTESGKYNLKVTNQYGCEYSDAINVNFTSNAESTLSAEFEYTLRNINEADFTNLSRGNDNSYEWNFVSATLTSASLGNQSLVSVAERSRSKRNRGNLSNEEHPTFSYNNKSFNVCLTTINSNGISCKSCKSIDILSMNNRLSDKSKTTYIKCSPNPIKEATLIEYSVDKSGKVNISIYDSKGIMIQEILSETLETGTYNKIWELPRNITPGVYYISLRYRNSEVMSERVIVK